MSARALARAGHTVYAGIRDTVGRNAPAVADAAVFAAEHGVDLRTVELDVADQASVDTGIARVVADAGHLDVVVHNAGHMVLGPTEAFTPEQLVDVYDTNVVSTQRVNRAALPHLRAQGHGLVLWVGSTSTRGGTPPYLAPYFAAKAAMDSLAVSYAAELARFGVDTTIVVPGSFTSGTNHFAHAGHASDEAVAGAYEERYGGLMDQVGARLAGLAPPDADPGEVGRAIVRVVDTPSGSRPFRVHVDPADDGAEVVNAAGDRVRTEFYRRIGLDDLLHARRASGVTMRSLASPPVAGTEQRRTRGRGRRPADEVRGEILDAAGELLLDEGMGGFTFERVSALSGASRTTLHKWWPSRGALAAEAYFRSVETTLAFPDTGDITADLTEQLSAFVRLVTGTGAGRVIAELIGWSQTDPELAAAYRERYSAPRRALAVTAIEQARDRGQLRPDIDAEAVVDQLWGACYHRLLIPDQPLTEAFARTLVDQLVRGLRAG